MLIFNQNCIVLVIFESNYATIYIYFEKKQEFGLGEMTFSCFLISTCTI